MKRDTRRILGLLAAVVLAACGSTSGSGGGGNSYAGKTIKLGAILSITGAGGVYGPQSRDGMKLAVNADQRRRRRQRRHDRASRSTTTPRTRRSPRSWRRP